MERFAQTAQRIASSTGKLEKIATLASYFRTLDDADLIAAARFFTGNPFATRDRRTLSIGGRRIVEVARRVWGFDDAALSSSYRATGDLGAALGPLVRPPVDAMLFSERLTPATLDVLFGEVAQASGKRANRQREAVLERILRACDDSLVATYVVKIITGDMRVGLREGLVLDVIASAFDADPGAVRRGLMACGDVGAVALAAKNGSLEELRVEYGTPIALFSRRLNDVTAAYPEVAAALATLARDAIFDGEIVAIRDERVQPFRTLQARLQRKIVEESLRAEVPVAYIVFDLLALDGDLLIDEPLLRRRE